MYSKENNVDVVGINDDNNSNENHNGEILRYIDTKSNETEWHQVPLVELAVYYRHQSYAQS